MVVLGHAAQDEHARGGGHGAHFQLLNTLKIAALGFREVGHHGLIATFRGINRLWGNGVSGGHGLGFLNEVKDFKRVGLAQRLAAVDLGSTGFVSSRCGHGSGSLAK